MKRFLVFAGSSFHPQGGWDDFVCDVDTAEQAQAALAESKEDWSHFIDTIDGAKFEAQ